MSDEESGDIYQKINNDKYKVKMEYPSKPQKPQVLLKRVPDLSDDEIRQIPDLRKRHEEEMKEYVEATKAWRAEESRLHDEFYKDLCEDFGVPHEDEFVQAMYGRAWQEGHSGGFGDVVSSFSDLMRLCELYDKKGKKTK